MNLARPCLAVSLFALAGSTHALQRDEVVEKVIEIGRSDPKVHEHLLYLTKRIGPRLTSSPNLTRACEWARAQFASYGLEAWTEHWGEFPVGFQRGPSSGGMVSPVQVDYVFGTNAWTAGTPGPVRGKAVEYPATLEELDEVRDQLPGAWLVELPRRDRPARDVRDAVDAVLEEVELAGRISNAGGLVTTSGRSRVDFDDLPTECRVRVQETFYEDLRTRLANGEEVELEFDIDNRFLPGPVPLYNVIADIKGTEFPDEYVVVGGHLDSWDGAEGAQDNGTGVSTTLEAARLLMEAGAKPRRTIRFMLWTGEEQGLLGSRAYVEEHADLMDDISAVLVHDGGTNYLAGIAGPEALIDELRWAFEPVVDLDSTKPFTVEQNEGLAARGSSDHAAFVAEGVPGFFWNQKGRTSYRFSWHTQNDTYEYAVQEYQRHSAMVVAIGAYNIAMLDEKLDRKGLIREGGGGRGRDLTRRRMGVQLDGREIAQVFDDTMASKAKWQEGDVVVSIDGVSIESRQQVVSELQKGGPRKVFVLKRGDELVESVLDYTGTPSEKAREEKRAAEAAAEKKKAEEEAAKEEKTKDVR